MIAVFVVVFVIALAIGFMAGEAALKYTLAGLFAALWLLWIGAMMNSCHGALGLWWCYGF